MARRDSRKRHNNHSSRCKCAVRSRLFCACVVCLRARGLFRNAGYRLLAGSGGFYRAWRATTPDGYRDLCRIALRMVDEAGEAGEAGQSLCRRFLVASRRGHNDRA